MRKSLLIVILSVVCSFSFGDAISNHVFGMQIEVETHFSGESNTPLGYEFDFEIATDTTVTNITVDCPSGFTFAISEFDEYWEEDYGTVVREWEHEVIASVPNFSQYGDGHYTTTVFYASGAMQSTVISFLQEDLSTPIPDISTKPVFSNPSPIQGESFPSSDSITFSWDNSDPGVNGVYLERWPDLPDADSEEFAEYWLGDGTFPVDHTDSVSFSPGNWYLVFYMFSGNAKTNADGIHCDTSKGCNTEYSFSVYDSSSVGDHVFMIEAGYGAHYASPTSSVPDEYEFYFEIDTDMTVTNIAVDCPGGHHFNLVDYDEDWEDIDFGIPVRDWEIEILSSVPHWAMFGDGNYTVTVSTVNGLNHTTVVPFLQSDQSTPLPDMTTKPVFTGPDPLQGETFDAVVPITLAWENTDPGVMGVFLERWLNVEDSDDEEIADYSARKGTYPADHTHPVFFDPGDWVIGFGLFSAKKEPNADGIICDTFKYTATEYQFNVTDAFSDLDTDHDGLPDLWEEYFYTNIALYGAESDPDGDTLENLAEFGLHSNPLSVDSDGDGVGDAVEVYWGSNPNHGSSIVHYVDPMCSSPQAPYTNWATAATNIQDAIDAAIAQDSNMGAIAVTNGTYHITSQIRVEELVIRSANGPEATIVDAGENCRCIFLEDSELSGFTLRNGHAEHSGGWHTHNGGAIRGGNTTITNCIISNNRADNVGGGIFGFDCTISDCVIRGNSSGFGGGGILSAGDFVIEESIISDNFSQNGGGIYDSENCVITACQIINNEAQEYGGGVSGGIANNCLISHNSALYGGGLSGGEINNCIVSSNSARFGGGVASGSAYKSSILNNSALRGGGLSGVSADNCFISGNTATWSSGSYSDEGKGGGMYSCHAESCTVVKNHADGVGGGSSQSDIYNMIVWYNSSSDDDPDVSGGNALSSCSPYLDHGENGNITNAPLFVDETNDNFRLQSGSPCIDAGDNDYVSTATDLEGNARIANGIVDMGAYEFVSSPGDTDADGIPDIWESEYFNAPGNCAPDADNDSDGHSNFQEYITGMDPTNAASFFVVDTMETLPTGYIINWNTVSGRVYGVYWSTNLVSGFQPLEPEIHYPQNAYTDTVHGAETDGFYKLNVRLEP